MINLSNEVGIVVIGRNEGTRLKKCIQSLNCHSETIVYIDSGSTDGSVEYVEQLGIKVVRLDMTVPFSAARARNEGFQSLITDNVSLKYIQFIDGDCQCCAGWLASAYAFLEKNESFAIVSGRRREKFLENSVYNTLCDIEWDTPIGEAEACGGDFMIRKAAFEQVGGFNPSVIAGEEPEMCYRLRKKHWCIYRIGLPMTIHDADITSFTQWWRRCLRSGHAYAQGFLLHYSDGKGYCFKESARIWFWACIFPMCVLLPSVVINSAFLILFTVYLAQFVRISVRTNIKVRKVNTSMFYSYFTIIGKWPELVGQLLFYARYFLRKRHTIIEYN